MRFPIPLPRVVRILCASWLLWLLCAPPAQADNESYYAPPQQMRSGFQLSYSDKFSQDYVNLNQNPLARFSTATASFYYDKRKKAISNLRVSITAGSVSSPDKDYTWVLLSQPGLNINEYEEIVLFSTKPLVFDAQNKGQAEGFLTLRGITSPVVIEARQNFIEEGNFLAGKVFGEKGAIGLSLSVNIRCQDFNMAPVDNNNKSRGDIGAFKYEMRAIKQ